MKYLFVHQNFPGQYLHLLGHLAKDPGNELLFISEPSDRTLPDVRQILYSFPRHDQEVVHPMARDLDNAGRRAEVVHQRAVALDHLGFRPDIIIGHHGWGELLNLTDVWPDVPMLGYFEFFYHTDGQDTNYDPEFTLTKDRFPRVRGMNSINLLALNLNKTGQTPTQWQYDTYPKWAQPSIRLIREGAWLDICKPDAAARKRPLKVGDFEVGPKDKLVTYVARNLEPYRGFHTMMRALPRLLSRKDVKIVMVGGDDVSYGARLANGSWREFFSKEMAGKYDTSRVLMPGQVQYDVYRSLLQRSDAHVYLTYPFVASWSLREALAMGCAVVAADVESVAEFVIHDSNGLLVPGLDHNKVADAVLTLLEDAKLNRRLRQGARRYAEQHLDMRDYIKAMEATIAELTGRTPPGG